jgi:ribosomal protein S18 acetylase RimI-like enzyme
MEYLLIDHPGDRYLPFVHDLYLAAFPQKERREWDQLISMIGGIPEMCLQVIAEEGKPIGMITSWKLVDWCFIEHFAVAESQRGKGYGQKVMMDFIAGGKVLLEVEPPSSADAIRRVNFYKRVGMVCLSFPYLQPSYSKTGKPYQMVLMSSLAEEDGGGIAETVKLVLEKVYHSPQGI